MRLGKYAVLNEETLEVLTKSSQHGIMTIEHITEFVETDPKEFPWLEAEIRAAKKYLETVSADLLAKRVCSLCGVVPPLANDDMCGPCNTLPDAVQRALFALRVAILEQAAELSELKKKK